MNDIFKNDILKEIDALQEKINKHRPLSESELKQIKEYYRIGLTYSSNALEGNSLTETETKIVLEDGITIGGKPLKDHYEAQGHSEAYDFMCNLSKKSNFTEEDILHLHELFYNRIDLKKAGVYRNLKAFITGSKYKLPLPEEIPGLMKKFLNDCEKNRKSMHPVEFAAWVHKVFVFIHPFVDGNGRVSRLLMNLVLLQAGYVIAIIPPVLRGDYIRFLEKAHVDDKDFVSFIAQVVKETQKDYLRLFV